MGKIPKIKPYINIGAGDIIKRNLDSLGWSQEDLSQITEISGKSISQIINNKQRVTVETAVLLSNAFGTSPEYWLNLDNNYRLNLQAEDSREKSTKTKAEIRKYMPVLEISKKRWFSSDNSALGYEKIYNNIWNTNSVDFSVYKELEPSYCARQAKENEEYTRLYSLTWYQIARTFSKRIDVPEYDKKKLEAIADKFTEYTILKNGVFEVIKDLNVSGVKFLVQSHLAKTYLDGACFFNIDNPVIVYTARYDRLDNFWFTVAHEIAHVLLHLSRDKKSYYLDNLDSKNISEIEKEADSKAEEILKVKDVIEYSKPFIKYFTDKNLRDISDKLRIEPSLILGILQYHKMVDYRKLSRYKKKVKELFPDKVMMG